MQERDTRCESTFYYASGVQPKTPQPKLKRTPQFVVGPSIAYIPLTKGQYALVDSDTALLDGYLHWYAQWNPCTRSYYAVREVTGGAKLQLHVLVLKPEPGFLSDHINGNTLDCRRANLRQATISQNAMNSRTPSNSKTGLKGAVKSGRRWSSRIRANGVTRHLGTFSTPEEAHEAYCIAAAELHGEFRRTA